jgi:hypothetical protein
MGTPGSGMAWPGALSAPIAQRHKDPATALGAVVMIGRADVNAAKMPVSWGFGRRSPRRASDRNPIRAR